MRDRMFPWVYDTIRAEAEAFAGDYAVPPEGVRPETTPEDVDEGLVDEEVELVYTAVTPLEDPTEAA
jgi:hypothetical protein